MILVKKFRGSRLSSIFSGLYLSLLKLLHNCEDHFHLYSLTAVHSWSLSYTHHVIPRNYSTRYFATNNNNILRTNWSIVWLLWLPKLIIQISSSILHKSPVLTKIPVRSSQKKAQVQNLQKRILETKTLLWMVARL